MDADTKKDIISIIEPEARLADGFEDALIGYAQIAPSRTIALYDRKKCLDILVARDGMSPEAAEEYFEYNVACAYVGDHTPAFAVLFEHADATVPAPEPATPKA